MDQNKTLEQSPESLLKVISIIHAGMLGAQLLFALMAFAKSTKIYFGFMYMDENFVYVISTLAIVGFFGGYMLFKRQLRSVRNKSTLNQKFSDYQTALIIRYALLEVPSLVGITAYLFTGNLFFLSVSGFLMVYFIVLRPTREKVDNDLQLDFEDPMRFGC